MINLSFSLLSRDMNNDQSRRYTVDDLNIIKFDDSVFEVVALSRSMFKRNLQEAAIAACNFTQTCVTNTLPDEIAYMIYYGCSYDGNPLVGDEKTFPENYA